MACKQTQCTPNVHPMYTQCTPNVHPMYTQCTPNVHPMYAQYTPNELPMYTQCAPNVHPMYTQCTPNVRPMYARADKIYVLYSINLALLKSLLIYCYSFVTIDRNSFMLSRKVANCPDMSADHCSMNVDNIQL